MEELNKQNYFSNEMNEKYMSVSQYKDFEECEVKALAKLKGEYIEEKSKALLIGSYVDSYFSNELDQFKEENPQIFKKDGTLLKDFEKANEIIKVIEQDELLMHYLSGEKQKIFTGTIGGVLIKIKVDSYLEDECIVDQKIIASIKELVWKKINGKNTQVPFVSAYGYDTQGAVYQEIVRQNTNKKLPFILAPTTKEEVPDKELIRIDQEFLDKALKDFEEKVGRYDLIKKGLVEPIGCGNCPVCRSKKVLKGVVSYKELYNLESEETDYD